MASNSKFLAELLDTNGDVNTANLDNLSSTLGTASTNDTGDFLQVANNLSDLNDAPTARSSLGLGTAATTDSTAYATAAQGATADTAYQSGQNIIISQNGTKLVDSLGNDILYESGGNVSIKNLYEILDSSLNSFKIPNITSAQNDDVLKYDNGNWVNSAISSLVSSYGGVKQFVRVERTGSFSITGSGNVTSVNMTPTNASSKILAISNAFAYASQQRPSLRLGIDGDYSYYAGVTLSPDPPGPFNTINVHVYSPNKTTQININLYCSGITNYSTSFNFGSSAGNYNPWGSCWIYAIEL